MLPDALLLQLTAPPIDEEEPPDPYEGTESQQQPEGQAKYHQQIQGFVMHQQQLQQHAGEHIATATASNAVAAAPVVGHASVEAGSAAVHEARQNIYSLQDPAVHNSATALSAPGAAGADAGVAEVGGPTAASVCRSYPGDLRHRTPPALMTGLQAEQQQQVSGLQGVQVAIAD